MNGISWHVVRMTLRRQCVVETTYLFKRCIVHVARAAINRLCI